MTFDPSSIRAISFDGDETLWDFRSAMKKALVDAADFLSTKGLTHAGGEVSTAWLRELRDEVAGEPEFARSPMEEIRLVSFERAVERCGRNDPALVKDAYDTFMKTRFGAMWLFEETAEVLAALHTSYPIVLVTNGNSNAGKLGVGDYFAHLVVSAHCGLFKPDPRIYTHAAGLLDVPPAVVLHVGDHPEEDVAAAAEAGMRTAYIDRNGKGLPAGIAADVEVSSLSEIVDIMNIGEPR
ncbi:HAD family hydrolase [Nocardiopsis aegyptia]|uniref:HAD family hydrolase n=1 Tax=Nocardiopsis aegyptia TaxID=220378 RepID=UPI00366F9995